MRFFDLTLLLNCCFLAGCLFLLPCCSSEDMTTEIPEEMIIDGDAQAVVENVTFQSSGDGYVFSVTIKSPDTGCNQYANWWEVIAEDGTMLIYRRILGHSHVSEQPFTRSGISINVEEDQALMVRAHMNNTGYGQTVFAGSIADGFSKRIVGEDFGEDLENLAPQPDVCPF